jgi:hypothetical protein
MTEDSSTSSPPMISDNTTSQEMLIQEAGTHAGEREADHRAPKRPRERQQLGRSGEGAPSAAANLRADSVDDEPQARPNGGDFAQLDPKALARHARLLGAGRRVQSAVDRRKADHTYSLYVCKVPSRGTFRGDPGPAPHDGERLFTANGYAGTATEEIVAAAGVTRGALYLTSPTSAISFAACS